jgi:threonine aldolase
MPAMQDAPLRRQFASDNRSGICPEAWAALQTANDAHAPSYGDDAHTQRAADLLRETFQTDCDVYFVFTGTAANSLALASLCQSYHSVICHQWSHIETDECGAPEFFSNGTKLLLAEGINGKLTVEAIESFTNRSDIHFPKPRVVSVTQATELGTVYTPLELTHLCTRAKQLGLSVHMDGARFANAVASLGCSPAELTWKCGVDVLCFGGTKNGMLAGEAVLFFDRSLGAEFAYRCKQAGQLASKMRFMSAQWAGMLHERAWLRRAGHANRMARRLETELQRVSGVRVMFPVEANGVFVDVPPNVMAKLRERGWDVYTFIGPGGARFMCSWDTTEADVERLVEDVRAARAE